MADTGNRRVVLAGGPGTGKTSVLEIFAARGIHCASDVAREIIRQRLRDGLTPRPGPVEFARAIFEGDVSNYLAAPADSLCFFERGVVDSLAMRRQSGDLSDDEQRRVLDRYRYHPLVFVFPPWEQIYRSDSERDQTFAESVRVFEPIRSWYERCEYQVQIVPPASVEERAAFIEDRINRAFATSTG
jgi:predicted ATPase